MAGAVEMFIEESVSRVWKGLDGVYPGYVGQELSKILKQHAVAGAALGLTAGIPGVGGTLSSMASVASLWTMYARINKALEIKLSDALLKSLATAVVANIATTALGFVGAIAVASAASFIPGIGTASADLIMAAANFALVVVAGTIYLKMIAAICRKGSNPENLSEAELKANIKAAVADSDVDGMMKEASNTYKKAFKRGEVTGKEKTSA